MRCHTPPSWIGRPTVHPGIAVNIVGWGPFWEYPGWRFWGAVGCSVTHVVLTRRNDDGSVIKSPFDELCEIIESYDECISELTFSGHGSGGVGVCTEPAGASSICFSDNSLSEEDVRRIRTRLCEDAVVNFCVCNIDGENIKNQIQRVADRLQRKVCACHGDSIEGTCRCVGTRICTWPQKQRAQN